MSSDIDAYRQALETLSLPEFGAPPPNSPFILAVEGPNGAGKTTLCGALAEARGAASCLGTDEAWFTETFKTRMIRDAEWYASAMFFLSGCFEQSRIIRARRERLVIMDRSLWSTLAIHAAESLDRLHKLLTMLAPVATLVQVPQLTVVLQASFDTCQARISKKPPLERALDQLTARIGFHAREEVFYQWLARRAPNTVLLDVNEATPREVQRNVEKVLRKYQC